MLLHSPIVITETSLLMKQEVSTFYTNLKVMKKLYPAWGTLSRF
jgi:hypothetical protein